IAADCRGFSLFGGHTNTNSHELSIRCHPRPSVATTDWVLARACGLMFVAGLSLSGVLRADEAQDLFGRGEALYQASDWKGAAESYAAVLAGFPDSRHVMQSLYSRGWAWYQAGEFERALNDFRAFQEKYPTNSLTVECQLKAADSLRQLRRYDEALRTYEQVRIAGSRLVPEALAGKAWTFSAQRDFAAAQGAFFEAAQAYGKDARAAIHLFNAGNAAVEARQWGAAVERFGQVQQEWPTNQLARAALYWQALALFRLNRADEAAAKLELLRQVGTPPELAVDSLVLLAQAQEARRKYAEAATLYASVVTNYPGHALTEAAAAAGVVALEKAGSLASAEIAAGDFLARYPASAQCAAIRFLLGEYRYRQANYAGSAPELERFVKEYPAHELAAAALHKAGWCHWNLKQPALARACFAAVVADYGTNALAVDAAFMKGRAAEEAGDAAGAADSYGEAVRLGRDNDTGQRAAVELIRLDHAAKRYEAALLKADAFLARHTTGASIPRARLYRAEALLEMNRLADAQQAYQLVGDADPVAAAGSSYGMAWVMRRQGRHAAAASAFIQISAGSSTYAADASFWAARSYEDAGNFEAASSAYGVCLRLEAATSVHADEAAYRQAYCLWQTRKPDDAQRLYDAVLQDRAASPFAANALYDLAWIMLERGKKDEAYQRFAEFVRHYPKHLLAPDAHFRIGELAYEKELYAVAATNYQTAAAAAVNFRDKALYKLGWTREKLTQHEAAAQTFLLLARQLPRSEYAPEAGYRAGCILQAMGRLEDARSALAAVTDGVFSEKAACSAADCWRAAAKHKEAADAYSQVLTRWPNGECRQQALLGRADALRALGAFADAVADYREAARAGETRISAQAMLGQGHCWFALQKWDEAARCFMKVDVLYEFDELKPEALAMAARSRELAGETEKAVMHRAELKKRFPRSREALGL
ncbi:MAG: tetratricopeptide repeat protein, partial [Kiritimatiellia bacterium]